MMFINAGLGNMINAGKIVAIVGPESAPIKRIIRNARDKGMLIDITNGRKMRAVCITDSDYIIISSNNPETIALRAEGNNERD